MRTRILLIDDEHDILDSLAKVLTGIFMAVVAFIALSWRIKTTGHE